MEDFFLKHHKHQEYEGLEDDKSINWIINKDISHSEQVVLESMKDEIEKFPEFLNYDKVLNHEQLNDLKKSLSESFSDNRDKKVINLKKAIEERIEKVKGIIFKYYQSAADLSETSKMNQSSLSDVGRKSRELIKYDDARKETHNNLVENIKFLSDLCYEAVYDSKINLDKKIVRRIRQLSSEDREKIGAWAISIEIGRRLKEKYQEILSAINKKENKNG